MPLRDHFRPPVSLVASWEGFHGGWPMVIVQQLVEKLPPRYVAAPRVHSGFYVEIDVATYDTEGADGGALAISPPLRESSACALRSSYPAQYCDKRDAIPCRV